MRVSTLASILGAVILSATAIPTAIEDFAPEGGWASVAEGFDLDKRTSNTFDFTSTYSVIATPDQVVNGTTPTGGLDGAKGFYNLGINSDLDFFCYSIKVVNFRGEYESAARTATHLHEAAKGASGPPRLAFKNPSGKGNVRTSYGCAKFPYRTGLPDDNGVDTGRGFSVAEIEANPAAFMVDVHSSLAVPGAVRGQLA